MAATEPERRPADRGGEDRTRSIGEVLAALRAEFPDVSISKIRFLETEGLVTPARTRAGYRRFTPGDLARLRYVLSAQRDRYLPLRVIKDELAAWPGDLAPAGPPGQAAPAADAEGREPAGPAVPASFFAAGTTGRRLGPAELAAAAGLSEGQLAELVSYRLVEPGPAGDFDPDAVEAARTVGRLARFGFEPRHLRAVVTAADRDAGMVAQVAAPVAHHRGEHAREHAAEVAAEVAALSVHLHAVLLRQRLAGGG